MLFPDMKLISWNVNGLRAVCGKGFAGIFDEFDADFVCLQETKLQAGQIDLEFMGYTSYWNYADRKGYSGTAVYTRHTPLAVTYGIGVDEFDHEGRVITLEMPDFHLVCVYVPNSQDGLKRLDWRMRWEDEFRAYVCRLAASKPVIICGDMNVAHNEIDLANPATNHFNAGFSDEEREKMTANASTPSNINVSQLRQKSLNAKMLWSRNERVNSATNAPPVIITTRPFDES